MRVLRVESAHISTITKPLTQFQLSSAVAAGLFVQAPEARTFELRYDSFESYLSVSEAPRLT